MNIINNKISELAKQHPRTIMVTDYSNGYADAIEDVIGILSKYQHLILEPAREMDDNLLSDDLILENKQSFVRNLGKVAAQTRDGCSGMELDDNDHVTISYYGGGTHGVNIRMDGWTAIMKDCSKNLD